MLLIKNADVYAPRPLGIRDLLIGGGRVLWQGPAAELRELPAALRATAATLDLDGARLIPGLIDGHVHVTGGGGEAGFRTRVPPQPPGRYTSAGVTTVVGLLGTDTVARGPEELLATLYALREEGLNAYGYLGGYHLPVATLTGSVRKDLVFVEAFVGLGEVAISDHRSSQPTLEELLRLGADAHVAGLMTGKAGIVHLHLGDGARGLGLVREALARSELPARVFNPTHVNRRRALFEEAIALAREGSTIDLTAFPVADGEDAYGAAEALARYLASGAAPERVTVSSDAGGCLPEFDGEGHVCRMEIGQSGALLATLAEAQERGLSLEAALPAFTANPARLLRLASKGRIATGADADLVALDATGGARTVIIGGELHVQDGAQVRRGTFET
ncbi:MAG TPA: beta-aspartyl-peptidase [Steroidobacteraceae bacterium]|nr:beta-aspartyl-peptidase [Steroidobacteraceae bacterium]